MENNNNQGSSASQTVSMPSLQPTNTTAWFALLEGQFEAAEITNDKIKFVILAKCLDSRHLQDIVNVMTNPPAMGRYEKLKCELIRILTDTDSARVKKMVESEEMGDRKLSQFYQHLRKLVSPSTPDDFILTLWRNRLSRTRIRRILAAVDDTNPEKLMRSADLIAEKFGDDHQCTAQITTVIDPPAQNVGTNETWLASFNALSDQMSQLRAQMSALGFNHRAVLVGVYSVRS